MASSFVWSFEWIYADKNFLGQLVAAGGDRECDPVRADVLKVCLVG